MLQKVIDYVLNSGGFKRKLTEISDSSCENNVNGAQQIRGKQKKSAKESDLNRLAISQLYSLYREVLQDLTFVEGLHGTLGIGSFMDIATYLGIDDNSIMVDFGAGDGRVLLCALALGACRAVGYELPIVSTRRRQLFTISSQFESLKHVIANGSSPHMKRRLALYSRIGPSLSQAPDRVQLIEKDILTIDPETWDLVTKVTHVYTYSFGMPREVQFHMLRLIAAASAHKLKKFIFTYEVHGGKKWNSKGVCDQVNEFLHEFNIRKTCELVQQFQAIVLVSRESHATMVFAIK